MPHEDRIRRFQSLLRARGIPRMLVTSPSNVRYLTGLDASEAMLLVALRSATLFVDARYASAAGALRSRRLKVMDRTDIARMLSRIPRCGYEEGHVTAGCLRRWKAACKNTKFIHTSSLAEGLRRKKDATEVRLMHRALSVTDDVLRGVPGMLRPGMTEARLAADILIACLERGADGMAFDTIVAFGPSTCEPHHRPGGRRLRTRDIVQVDMGAKVGGYCSDRSEVFFIGKPTAEQRRTYDAVSEAKERAKSLLKAGVPCADLDRSARSVLAAHSLEGFFTHSLGHGLGLDIHEGVSLSSRSADSLLSGEVVTIEPGVYLPGKFGIRLEDTVFVK